MKQQRLIAVHLSSDYSSSLPVLMQSLEVLQNEYEVHFFSGDVNEQPHISSFIIPHTFYSRAAAQRIIRFLIFLISQASLFIQLLRFLKPGDTVYINTLLPAAAATAARIKKCRVVYHVHDMNIRPLLLKKWLCYIAGKYADKVIFASAQSTPSCTFKKAATSVIRNVLPSALSLAAAGVASPNTRTPFTVSMHCPLKKSRGVYEFVRVAARMPRVRFILSLAAPAKAVQQFIKEVKPPVNCFIIPAAGSSLPVHKQSHLVLNLSRAKELVEVFDMSILEAMSCGRPVIIPSAWAITELVEHGVEGFYIDAADETSIITAISRFSSDIRMYCCFAAAARERSLCFRQQQFARAINSVFSFAGPAPAAENKTETAYEETMQVPLPHS